METFSPQFKAPSPDSVPRPARRVALLGSTGSIGRNTLRVVEELGDKLEITGLAAGQNWHELANQAIRFRPRAVSVGRPEDARALRGELISRGVHPLPEIGYGEAGITAVATESGADTVVAAIVGVAGLRATHAAVNKGCRIALANKETLVAAGSLIMQAAAQSGATIVPVDSEHSAIHQCLRAGRPGEVARLILTASGGPFRDWPDARLATATPQQALQHPTWQMGGRITIDSATLMNKGFEIIEACHLFQVAASQTEVLIHPQSIVHSLVEFRDGSVMAQLGVADMRIPIQYALTYPERNVSFGPQRLRLEDIGRLDFSPPDAAKFPCLALARQAHADGPAASAALNAADEVAVEAFCARRLRFTRIAAVIEEVVAKFAGAPTQTVDDVLEIDGAARQFAASLLEARVPA